MPIQVSKIKALCFDVDGTLSDTDDLYIEKIEPWLPKFLFKDTKHTARRLVMWLEAPGNALLSYADRLGLDDEMVAVINWLALHRKHTETKFLLVPEVDELLKQLHGRYPMAVVSARDERGTLRFLEAFGLNKYFDVIVSGLSAEHTKPYPDPILYAAKKMNVAPEACLMIGDTTVDIRAGKSAGAQTVGVLCGFGEEAELRRFDADEIIESTPKLLELLR
ncbi:MAG: HAD-IA family hydrolase [Anaerolineales bacterium]|nr:HAD-IA family hydrolase [Anaerolineales bacterium]MCZ2120851.1 HAD-IA family hydrolase [Anaerolineales bacterium]